MSLAMKVLCVLSILLGAALAQQLDSATNDEQRNKMALDSLSASVFNFTSDLYSVLSKSPGNMIFSPLSIHSILTMTSLGARSHTAEQMRQALHLSDITSTTRAYKQVYNHLKSMNTETVALDIANKIYVKKAVTLNADFLQESREVFQSEAEVVDFTAADAAYAAYMIKNYGYVDNESMVLATAVSFRADWKEQFVSYFTETKPFHLADGSTLDVRMMEGRPMRYAYMEAEDSHTQVLELPYNDCNVSMIVLLPSADRSLRELEAEIKEKGLHSFVDNLTEVRLKVFLPKFRVELGVEETYFDLEGILKFKLGMTSMFESGADFSGITDNGVPLQVSRIDYKAFIEVNEEGTEAVVETGGKICLAGFMDDDLPDPPVFNAERPFVFAIYHKTSKQVILMGRYAPIPEDRSDRFY